MASEERQPNADLSAAGANELEETLARFQQDASKFSFYRLVYLLERLFPNTPRLGHTGPAKDERIRMRADHALVFSASDVTGLAHRPFPDGERRVQVSAAFLGLYAVSYTHLTLPTKRIV